MGLFDDSPALSDSLACPTCNARQVWSVECRRCKSDLSMLVQAHDLATRLKTEALTALREGRHPAARDAAAAWRRLDQSPAAGRLLAVCTLLVGNLPGAVELARSL